MQKSIRLFRRKLLCADSRQGDISAPACVCISEILQIRLHGIRQCLDGSYLRLKTVTIGYTFPEKITKKIGMKGLRIAFSGTNLLTFTNYLGMDPEMSSSVGSSNSKLGIDQSSYPAARLYTLNVNFKF